MTSEFEQVTDVMEKTTLAQLSDRITQSVRWEEHPAIHLGTLPPTASRAKRKGEEGKTAIEGKP